MNCILLLLSTLPSLLYCTVGHNAGYLGSQRTVKGCTVKAAKEVHNCALMWNEGAQDRNLCVFETKHLFKLLHLVNSPYTALQPDLNLI